MKKICNILICLFISSTILVSCDSMLDVDSNRLVTDTEYGHASSDSLYSTFGVLSQLQKLADSYVLLGELRGDLM
ncbi:MAG: RagB/SusD family nutrient uptake outer membrane protein, partial [Paludibacter sp.]